MPEVNTANMLIRSFGTLNLEGCLIAAGIYPTTTHFTLFLI